MTLVETYGGYSNILGLYDIFDQKSYFPSSVKNSPQK